MHRLSPEQIRDALYHVSSEDRDTWIRCGMALKSEVGESGYDLWMDWSATGSSFNEKDARIVWRSFKASGGITIGSLLFEAMQSGWELDRKPEPIPRDAMRKFYEDRRQRIADEERETRERQEKAAASAKAFIGKCRYGPHPYLERKGYPQECGLISPTEGRLIVPMWDCMTMGKVNSLQSIDVSGKKLFLPGGKAKLSVFRLGDQKSTRKVLCEGYATALAILHSLKEMFQPVEVVVCFSAGNLRAVAAVLDGEKYVVADYDIPKQGEEFGTGEAAAIATGLPFWIPARPDTDADDFVREHGRRKLGTELVAMMQSPEARRLYGCSASPTNAKSPVV